MNERFVSGGVVDLGIVGGVVPAAGASSSVAAEDEEILQTPAFVSREIKLVPNAASIPPEVEEIAEAAMEDVAADST